MLTRGFFFNKKFLFNPLVKIPIKSANALVENGINKFARQKCTPMFCIKNTKYTFLHTFVQMKFAYLHILHNEY